MQRERVLANGGLLDVHRAACQLAFVNFMFAAKADLPNFRELKGKFDHLPVKLAQIPACCFKSSRKASHEVPECTVGGMALSGQSTRNSRNPGFVILLRILILASTDIVASSAGGVLMAMVHFGRSAWVVSRAALKRLTNRFIFGAVGVLLAACGGGNEVVAPTETNVVAPPIANDDLVTAAASTAPEKLFPTPNATPAQCKASQQYWERLFAHPERLITYTTDVPPDSGTAMTHLSGGEFQALLPYFAHEYGNPALTLTTSYGGWGYAIPCGPNGPEVYIDVAFTTCENEAIGKPPQISGKCYTHWAIRWRMDPLETFDPQYPWWNMRKPPWLYLPGSGNEFLFIPGTMWAPVDDPSHLRDGRVWQRLVYASKAFTFDPAKPVWAPYFYNFYHYLWRPLPGDITNRIPTCFGSPSSCRPW
jgi:hypothetical protein